VPYIRALLVLEAGLELLAGGDSTQLIDSANRSMSAIRSSGGFTVQNRVQDNYLHDSNIQQQISQ
jgi:hypothetical protein